MPALAYVLLPLTGMLAYFLGNSSRTRAHGLQAVAYGIVWPACIYGASLLSSAATRLVSAGGALLWVLLIVLTAAGKDPVLPVVARLTDGRRNTSGR